MRRELLTKLQSHLHFANLIKRIKGCPRQLQRWAVREEEWRGGEGAGAMWATPLSRGRISNSISLSSD